jgi:hypothetical protein
MALVPLTLACILTVQAQYGFPRETMFALLMQEAGNPGVESLNANKTKDLGPYQVNTIHVERFARQWGVDRATAHERLRDDGCENAKAAGQLLNEHWQRTGDIWQAIKDYHSRTPVHGERYGKQVYDKVLRLYEPPRASKAGGRR